MEKIMASNSPGTTNVRPETTTRYQSHSPTSRNGQNVQRGYSGRRASATFQGIVDDREDRTELGASVEASPWLGVVHHIKETFLEPAKRQQPLPLKLFLGHPPDDVPTDETLQIDVMPRTTFPERVSRFDVLKFQMDKVVKWPHAAPAPQHPVDRPDLSTPAFATAVAPNIVQSNVAESAAVTPESTVPVEYIQVKVAEKLHKNLE
ncbi:hypothetical protein BGX30_000933 [Mortierella sp. GBA39]|nr:hypothetical protein BGX30_000933 [Mortierella sp. GBA39]